MYLIAREVFRFLIVFCLLIVLVKVAAATPEEAKTKRASLNKPSFRIGLWVEAEGQKQPFNSAKNFNHYQKFINNPYITDIFCQVYRGGRSWYTSEIADDTPYQQAKAEGFDPLEDTIKLAHERGQKVHAWVNLLRIANNKNAPIVKDIGRDAVLVDSFGVSLLDYVKGSPKSKRCPSCKIGTPGIWLEVANPNVREYLKDVVRELLLNYPQLDGLHFDMVRSPITSPQFVTKGFPYGVGYSKEVVDAFYANLSESEQKKQKQQRFPFGP